MEIVIGAIIVITGGFLALFMMSCCVVAKHADEQRESIFASLATGYHSDKFE